MDSVRFFNFTSKFTISDDCWEWTGSKNTKGYGNFWGNGKCHKAHRVSYELLVGPIPKGLVLDHECRNKSCVNPKHLTPRTNRDNILRGNGPSALNSRKSTCNKGHEFAPRPGGGRRCYPCMRERTRKWKMERKSK